MSATEAKANLLQQALPFAPTFAEITIEGVTVLTACVEGQTLMTLRDMAKLLNYSPTSYASNIRAKFKAKGRDLSMHLTLLVPSRGRKDKLKFVDLDGLRFLCDVLPPNRTAGIRGWMDVQATDTPVGPPAVHVNAKVFTAEVGGSSLPAPITLPTDGVQSVATMLLLAAPKPTRARQAQAKPKPTNPDTERKRDYCKKLCKVLTRYATADELPVLIDTLENFKSNVLAKRYAPGLNDAAYDLYAIFNLRGEGAAPQGKGAA